MRPLPALLAAALFGAFLAAGPSHATVPSDYAFELVHPRAFGQHFDLGVQIRFSPDGRMWVPEVWNGRVRVYADTLPGTTARTWATLPVFVGGERGLLGMAFHPQFPDSPWVYLFQTTPNPGSVNRVIRLRDSSGVGVNLTVIRTLGSGAAAHHHGGRMAFSTDGMLYVSHGEGDTATYAQDVNSTLRGKILRMTPMGQVPADNPFGPNNYTYAYGVRNPYGITVDRETGHIFFTENGNNCQDELNYLVPGGNYAWWYGGMDQCSTIPPGTIPPILAYTPVIAPTGAAFFRQHVDFRGQVLFGDFNEGQVRRVYINAGDPMLADSVQSFFQSPDGQVLDVSEGPDGMPWILTLEGLYRTRKVNTVSASDPTPRLRLGIAPNPSRREVAFSLPDARTVDEVTLLDLAGRRVRSWNGALPATIRWDGRDAGGRAVGQGVFFVRVRSGAETFTQRLIRLGE